MTADAACDLLDRIKSTSHGPLDPAVQETTRPIGRNVFPQQLKTLLEQITAYALEVVLEQIGELGMLLFGQVLLALQEAPSAALEHRLVSLLRHTLGFGGTDFVQGFVQPSHNVEPVQNMHGMRGFLGDHLQIGLPHVTANELDGGRPFTPQHLKKSQQRLGRTILAHP